MSTTLLMGRIPRAVRRLASHWGDVPTVTSCSTRAPKRPHRSGSTISTRAWSAAAAPVVANAGVALRKPLVEVEPEEYDRVMEVNVRGVFFVVQAALRAMLPRRAGSVVAVSSTSGFTASTGPMAVYDASKAAVRLLTQAAAREAAQHGVRVNAVAPGTVETELTLDLLRTDSAILDEQIDDVRRLVAVVRGRVVGAFRARRFQVALRNLPGL